MPLSPTKRARRSSSSSSSSSSNSRSRKRSQSRRHSPRRYSPGRDHRSRRSRSRGSSRRRSRSRESSRRRRKSVSPVPERPIASDDPKYLNARIFVGHLPSDRVDKFELEKHFAIYGNILDASVHPRGYGFVQFHREEDARSAVEKEQRSLIKGSIIDVKMAAEGRRDRVMVRERLRGGSPYGDHPPGYPPRDRDRDPPPRGPPRDRSPVRDPYDDRYRDPYREPRESARPPPPPRDSRDPYFDDPYRRPPPPDPYYDRYRDDPYRRDPYVDPYRDPYRDPYYEPPPRKPPPAECVVVLMKTQLRNYGESIERKVKALNVISDIVVIPEDKTLAQQIEDISRHGGLFAIVINSQNELHHSLTVNILHGSPQEHRNMPVEDAMNLISRSFEKYLQSLKEKAAGGAPPAPASSAATPAAVSAGRSQPFLPPSKEVSYLLNLLADNRQLTLEELDKVIIYLRDRRDKMIESERMPIAGGDGGYRDGVSGRSMQSEDGLLQQQQQQELQTKILSILNGSGQPTPGSNSGPSLMSSHGQPPPVAPVPGGGGVNTALINFDNPSVQKALDNLIQSGPNLLRNIGAASSSSNVPGNLSGPSSSRDPSRPGLLSTPPGGPRANYPSQGMGGAPPMRGMGSVRPRY